MNALLFVAQFFIAVGDIVLFIIKIPFILKAKLNIRKIKLPQFFEYSPIIFKTKYFLLGIIASIIIIGINQAYSFVISLPSPRGIGKVNFASSTHILDRNGKLLFEIYRDKNRTPVKLKDLPPYIYQATVTFEDRDFFRHNGISLFGGIIRAVKETFIKKDLQGGSTITQQLVKNSLLSPERTISRKIKELILALWTERLYTKKQILEMYLNQVPYGGSSYGIEEAAKIYFGKRAKDLRLDEAAMLVTMPQAPTLYSPYMNPELVLIRRNGVLGRMREQGYITQSEELKAKSEKLEILPPKNVIHAPHFVFYIKSILENLYGIQKVEQGGLRVETTLDLDAQDEIEQMLKDEIDKIKNLNVTNGGIIVTKPQTGEILAMVGSVDYFASPSGAFNVTTALRQPGSAGKPFLYSLALSRGYAASSIIEDTPATFRISEVEAYNPVNYDGRYHGKIPLRYALANSYNVPAVKVLNNLGVDDYVRHARNMGILTWTDPLKYGLSLALGGAEVTMTDMATAYGVFANQGYKVLLNGIKKIEDINGNIIYEAKHRKTRVIDSDISYIISDILSDNEARKPAFGINSSLEIPGYKVSVKTGTTNDKKDNWTVGYTPEFLATVWVGNNDGSSMNPQLTSGITGAAPIWNRVMSYIMKKYDSKNQWFARPDNVIEKSCYFGRKEYFIRGKEAPCQFPIFAPTATPTP